MSCQLLCQQNTIDIKGVLDIENHILKIQQEIKYFNNTDSILSSIYLHNWANSFRDRKTPLSKRFVKDFRRDLYFAKSSELGYSTIHNLTIDNNIVVFNELKNQADIVKIDLIKNLKPGENLKINTTYTIKIPDSKFTNYGKNANEYFLRYWYLTPAVYSNKWHLMSNLNIDDLYEENTNFTISIDVPKSHILESNLYTYETKSNDKTNYYLVAKSKTDVILSITRKSKFISRTQYS